MFKYSIYTLSNEGKEFLASTQSINQKDLLVDGYTAIYGDNVQVTKSIINPQS